MAAGRRRTDGPGLRALRRSAPRSARTVDQPPFEPTVRDGFLYARGASDDKGQVFTHIKSVEAWLKTAGRLPVNVKFVIEGEEEVGSHNLDRFLAGNRDLVKCDVAVVSDTSQYAPGIPAITYGLRGILACEVTLHGPEPRSAQRRLWGIGGQSVQRPGPPDRPVARRQAPDSSSRLLRRRRPPDAQGTQGVRGSSVRRGGVSRRTSASRRPGAKRDTRRRSAAGRGRRATSTASSADIPDRAPRRSCRPVATAKITCRLVPNQDPEKLLPAVERFLADNCPPGLRMEFQAFHGCSALVFDSESRFMQAARRAVAGAFGAEPVMIREGGSIPVVATFRDVLGVDTLLLGWGQNSDNLHSPNERFTLADFHRGTRASAHLWSELANRT